MFDNRVAHRIEEKYLGYTFLLKADSLDSNRIEEPKECTDVFCSANEEDDTIFIGFKNGFVSKEDCFFFEGYIL